MSATIISDPVMVSAPETQPSSAKLISQTEIEFANCDCCGLTEECTPAYIERVRKRYNGKWLCGLCAEAVKDEVVRNDRMIGIEEALDRHMNFCNKVRSPGPPPDPTELLISAMRHILRRSFDSSRTLRSTPNSPHSKDGALSDSILTRSESCFPTFSG